MIEDLQALLDDHDIRYFSAKEVVRARRWNKLLEPPEDLWENILPALTIADCAREAMTTEDQEIDDRVRVVSGYRDDRYNTHVDGAPTSEHMSFRALDLQPFDAARMEELRSIMVALVEYARSQGIDARLIHYDAFVHVDVGAAEGKPRGSRLGL